MTENSTKNKLNENELKFWSFAFEDLHKTLERIPKDKKNDYFKHLFFPITDYEDIKAEVLNAASYGHNIIIQGLAGSGKTTLARRYAIDTDFEKKGYYPLYVATLHDNKVVGYISTFVKKMIEYISKIKYDINMPNEINPHNIVNDENARKALNYLQEIISQLDIPSRDTKPLIFLDDLDYAEERWEEITDLLRDFIANSNIAFVFTLRPRLEKIILSHPDDRVRYLYHNTEKAIMIIPDLPKIILSRIHPLIEQEKNDNKRRWDLFAMIRNYFLSYEYTRVKSIYEDFFTDLGVDDIDTLTSNKISFPFHEGYLNFMKKVTGSNLRRSFLIAKETILFLRKNKSSRIELNKNGSWEIDKEIIAQLFMNNPNNEWNFLDIHSDKLRNDVSLYYAILHILHDEPENEIKGDSSYRIIKKKLKVVTKDEIKKACKTLASKEWALIDFIGHYNGHENKYKLNSKGLYYLDVANWSQYKEAYGNHNWIFRRD